ncbi:phage adaptor protein [Azospirillum palustre]
MATFLQLCQSVARDSGTVSGAQPVSVSGQSGRLAKIVQFTAEAWTDIQNARSAWLWMRSEFEVMTIAGTAEYTAAAWNLTDLAEWIVDDGSVTLYDQAIGPADEHQIEPISWDRYRRLYGRGEQVAQRPIVFSVKPNGAFLLGPAPDGAYVVRGEYRTLPQVLTVNADTPAMPARFHDAIKWRALQLLAEHDEAPTAMATAATNYRRMLGDLERDQLPQIIIAGGPLA